MDGAMRLLIDTHVWLWLETSPERIPAATLARLSEPEARVVVSAASIWELAIKHHAGRLGLPTPLEAWVADRMARSRLEPLPITTAHALAAAALPPHHRDPFDRMLLAQARIEGLSIVSADRAFSLYGASPVWA
jgi:PIN domain nuclease of toxin-antitoxin system